MVTRIKKIISFLEERKKKIEEQIRRKEADVHLLKKKKEKFSAEVNRIRKEFFSKIKSEKRADVNKECRLNIDFYKNQINGVELKCNEVEMEIKNLKTDLRDLLQRTKSLENFVEKMEKRERASLLKKEEKEINNLIMVKYCGR